MHSGAHAAERSITTPGTITPSAGGNGGAGVWTPSTAAPAASRRRGLRAAYGATGANRGPAPRRQAFSRCVSTLSSRSKVPIRSSLQRQRSRTTELWKSPARLAYNNVGGRRKRYGPRHRPRRLDGSRRARRPPDAESSRQQHFAAMCETIAAHRGTEPKTAGEAFDGLVRRCRGRRGLRRRDATGPASPQPPWHRGRTASGHQRRRKEDGGYFGDAGRRGLPTRCRQRRAAAHRRRHPRS